MRGDSPSELPSGAEPGEARRQEGEAHALTSWGEGTDAVSLASGSRADGNLHHPDDYPEGLRVTIRSRPGVAVAIGDPSRGQILLAWKHGSCVYNLWLGPGITLAAAAGYARRV